MRKALVEFGRCGFRTVLLDGEPALTGIMLRSGLVDELSLAGHPCLACRASTAGSLFRDPESCSAGGNIKLQLNHFEKMENGIIWLRYEVIR